MDTPDAFKNIFHQDKEFAKGYGGELKSGALKFGSEDMPPSLTDKELTDAQKEQMELAKFRANFEAMTEGEKTKKLAGKMRQQLMGRKGHSQQ